MKKALLALSGGVDSTVAALLAKREGFDCTGCTMILRNTCGDSCGSGDVSDAAASASALGIPFETADFTAEFEKEIIGRFISAYLRGVTPNPCVDCNRFIKFGLLLDKAEADGCDCLMTGHYARVGFENGKYLLRRAADRTKDQTYFLCSLTQERLSRVRFPLGEMTKAQAKEIAAANGFACAQRPESQDICFVPDGDYASVIEKYGAEVPPAGDFTDTAGNILGRHRGIIHYTVGQRRGLGIAAAFPYYVLGIDPGSNTVVLGKNEDLFSDTVRVRDINWISGEAPAESFRCEAKIRYRHREAPATVYPDGSGGARIVFDEPQRAVTPGQTAVMYDGDVVLGGGTII